MAKGKEDVLAKIKNLLDLGTNNPNQHEAAVALSKARDLMLKYQVDDAELTGLKEKAAGSPIITWVWEDSRGNSMWEKQLCQAVGVFCGAHMYLTSHGKSGFVVAESDVDFLKYCLEFARGNCLAAAVGAAVNRPDRSVSAVSYKNSFLIGAARGFYSAAVESRTRPMSTPETTALAVTRGEQVAKVVDDMFKGQKRVRIDGQVNSRDGYVNGVEHGRRMQILKPIEG